MVDVQTYRRVADALHGRCMCADDIGVVDALGVVCLFLGLLLCFQHSAYDLLFLDEESPDDPDEQKPNQLISACEGKNTLKTCQTGFAESKL